MTASIINKTIKSIVAASAALIMAASVAACGPNAATPSEENNASNGGATTSKVTARSLDEIKKSGVLKVAVFSDKAPFGYIDKDGKNAGYDIVFAERLAKDLGVELQLVPTKWAGIIPALMAGKFDVIIGSMSVTPERNLKANFTVPYDYATIEVMANKEKTKGMKFPEDFNKPEVVVALRTGSTPVPVAKKVLPNATFRLFDDEAPAVQDVLSGRADVMFSSAPLPAFEVLRNPDKLYQPSTDAFYRQPVGMVIRKGDPDSLNVLDNWIRTVEAEGWLPERRHFWFKTTDWEAQLR